MTLKLTSTRSIGLLLIALAAAAGFIALRVLSADKPPQSLYAELEKAHRPHSILSLEFNPSQTRIEFVAEEDPFFFIPFKRKLTRAQKLGITFAELTNTGSITVTPVTGDAEFSRQAKDEQFTHPKTTTYQFKLVPADYNLLKIEFDGRARQGRAIITELTLSDVEISDYQYNLYILALVLAAMFIVPGALIYSLITRDGGAGNLFCISFFGGTILFYFVIYLVFASGLAFGLNSNLFMLLTFIFLIGILLALVLKNGRIQILARAAKGSRNVLVAYLVLVVLSCWIITFKELKPFENFHYRHVSGSKTFLAFNAHDNIFQFYNGKAIAEDEPFSKYYGDRSLVYSVQDRQMLPGVVYAMLRKIISALSPSIGGSYLTYTIIGVCMNAMIIFPLVSIFRRFFGKKGEIIFFIVLSLNAFVLFNLYVTWFKFAGAALFLSMAAVLLEDQKRASSWIYAGVFSGLAANMHAGNALGIPLLFLWFFFKRVRVSGWKSVETFLIPIYMVVIFVALNLPWTIVKKVYYPETYALLKTHYMAGYSHGKEITRSFRKFIEAYTVDEQIRVRTANLRRTLRLDEVQKLLKVDRNWSLNKFLVNWSRLEWNYLVITLYPLVLFVLISELTAGLANRFRPGAKKAGASRLPALGTEPAQLFLISLLSVALLIGAAFGRHAPDITYHLPMGLILLIQTILIGWVLTSGVFIRVIFYGYTGFTAARLVFSYIHHNPQWLM